ncbi:hypothetical protein GGQ22_16010 [Nocardioides sp. zg-579]|uniref:Laminin G domain-containing protein n=1 Tax=Nocardioides marmotae TaxID=2663857 RepID=A0A6I3JEP0_9ACTN|nr:LamG domain-containing protein [Nocardioides marmotae]MCR6032931.1 hypothetical protein [Gordonia jinghuaiqii]MTB96581.1 hypothetical protein [Nocardioides marmotae]QKE01902.1 hypothetical protein HPC71_13120 [Nocardioides marmotae]
MTLRPTSTTTGLRRPIGLGVLTGVLALAALTACEIPALGRGADGETGEGGRTAGDAPAAQADADPGTFLLVDFEEGAAPPGSVIGSIANRGSYPVWISMATQNGGRLVRAAGVESTSAEVGGTGARLPYLDEEAVAAAAVVVRPAGTEDQLSPGIARFTFGADLSLDPASDGVPTDDGDNVLQRGLYRDPVQYKLQVDHRVLSCRIAGDRGEVVVAAAKTIQPGRWHRAACTRRGRTVTVSLARARPDGTWSRTWTQSATGDIGRLAFDPAVPLSVGAKVDPEGVITASATDQFNGVLDNVHVGRPGR